MVVYGFNGELKQRFIYVLCLGRDGCRR